MDEPKKALHSYGESKHVKPATERGMRIYVVRLGIGPAKAGCRALRTWDMV